MTDILLDEAVKRAIDKMDCRAVRYIAKNGQEMMKDLTDDALKEVFKRLETKGYVELVTSHAGEYWKLTPEGMDLATVLEVMLS